MLMGVCALYPARPRLIMGRPGASARPCLPLTRRSHAVSTVGDDGYLQNAISTRDASQARIVYIGRLSLVGFSLAAYIMALTVPGVLVTIGIAALAGTAQLIIPTIGAITWKKRTPPLHWRVCGRALPACSS